MFDQGREQSHRIVRISFDEIAGKPLIIGRQKIYPVPLFILNKSRSDLPGYYSAFCSFFLQPGFGFLGNGIFSIGKEAISIDRFIAMK